MSEITYKSPENIEEFKEYDLFRWNILRKPLGKDISSLKDEYDKSAFHLVGIKNNKIIACGRLHFNGTDEAQIRYMAVKEEFRKLKLGKLMLKELESYAFNMSLESIYLNSRESAVEFYIKNGYKIIEKSHLLFGNLQHWLMEKNIKK